MNITGMYEYYEYALQRSRILLQFIDELQGVWNDSAAQAIQTRVLEPHKMDSEHLLKAFADQHESFVQIHLKLQHIEELTTEFQELDDAMEREQAYIQEELNESNYKYDQSLYYNNVVSTSLPEIYQYIQYAKQGL